MLYRVMHEVREYIWLILKLQELHYVAYMSSQICIYPSITRLTLDWNYQIQVNQL